MSPILFNIINTTANSDINVILNSVEKIVLPIIYTLSSGILVFCVVKFGLKIQNDPRNKGIYIKHLVWCVIGCIIVLAASGIAHTIFNELLTLKQ